MKDQPTSPSPLQIDFGPSIGTASFATTGSLREFGNRLRDEYAWAREPRFSDDYARQVQKPLVSAIDAINAHIEAYASAVDSSQPNVDPTRATLLETARVHGPRILSSDSAQFAFARDQAGSNHRSRLLLVGYFTKRLDALPLPSTQDLSVLMQAALFDAGARHLEPGAAEALKRIGTQWTHLQGQVGEALNQYRLALQQHNEEWFESSRTRAETSETSEKERAQEFRNFMDSSKSDIDAFKKAYNQELATHSAVDYWRSKAINHRWLALLSAIVLTAGAYCFIRYAPPNSFELLQQSFGIDPKDHEWRIGVLVGLVLLGVWGLRLIVRILLSQIHLAADASHRRITIQSYLALLKDKDAELKPKDRELILGTVFRPIHDGLVRDDAMPPSVLELATRGSSKAP